MTALALHPEAPDSVWVVVALSGELDFASTGAFGVLDEAVRTHPGARVLVDLSSVTFMDSAALHAFVSARSRAAAGGGVLSLHGASNSAQRLLNIWHLEPGTPGSQPPGAA